MRLFLRFTEKARERYRLIVIGDGPRQITLLSAGNASGIVGIGIVKGKPFNPDARMRKILTEAAAIGTATGRTLNWRSRASEGFITILAPPG